MYSAIYDSPNMDVSPRKKKKLQYFLFIFVSNDVCVCKSRDVLIVNSKLTANA